MANQTFNIKVNVTDGGDVEKIKKALAGLGATVTSTRKQTSDANKSSNDFFDTQKKGIIGTANSTKSFSKLAETIGGQSSGLVGAYATLAANAFAVTAAFNALRGASQVEQIFRGLEAAGIRTGRSLTTTSEALKEVTGNAISTEQALRSTAQITSAGFGQDAVERLGKAARDTSFALGRNMTDSLDRLSRGVVKLEPELLDELGIMTKLTESNTLYAQKLGKTEGQLTNFEKRQGFLNAVLAEAELKFGGLSAAAGDSTAYDKLIAKFSNLTNSILNAVNAVAKPIAGVLANSTTLVLGVALTFASTLRNQLLPGLARTAAAAKQEAVELRELAAQKLENIHLAREQAAAETEAALAAKTNFNFIGTAGPKGYQAVADAVRSGTKDVKLQQAAIVSLQRSYRANDQILKNNPAYNTDASRGAVTQKGLDKAAANARIQEEIAAIKALQDAQTTASKADVEATERVRQAKLESMIATRNARAQELAAGSIGAASQLKLVGAWRQLVVSVKAYGAAQALASADGVTAFTGLRVAAFAAATGIRVIGTAFLSFMPYIGLITIAIGLIQSALSALKSDRTKAIEKAFGELSDVTDKTTDYVQELVRVNESIAPASLRAASAITIQSNAITEATDKFSKLVDILATFNESTDQVKDDGNQVASMFSLSAKGWNSYSIGVGKASKGLDLFEDQLSVFSSSYTRDEALTGSIKYFDTLSRISPKATSEVLKLYGGLDNLKKLPYEQRIGVLAKIGQEVADKTRDAADQVKNLQESFKALGQSIADFNIRAVASTPYDQIIKNLDSVSSAIKDLQHTANNGSGIDFSNLITGVDPNLVKFFNNDTSKALDKYREADTTIQQLGKGKELNAVEQQRLETAKNIKATGHDLALNLVEQTAQVRALFVKAQEMERTYKSQLDLLNAHSQAVQLLYTRTGAGVRARIANEEKVRSLQVEQLKTERTINEASIARARARIQELKALGDITEAQALMLKNEKDLQQQQMESALQRNELFSKNFNLKAVQAANGVSGNLVRSALGSSKEAQELAAMIDNYRSFLATQKPAAEEAVKRATELENLRNSTRDTEANIKSLTNQINALLEQQLTPAQKIAAINAANVDAQNSLYNTLNSQRKALQDISQDYDSINSIVSSVNDSLSYQLKIMRDTAEDQKRDIQARANQQIAAKRAEIDTAKSMLTRSNLSKEERASAGALIGLNEQELTLIEQQANIDQQRVDSQLKLNIASKVYFDTAKDGLDWQQTALGYLDKQLSTQRSLSEEIGKNIELQTKLNYKRRGLEVSDAGNEALEIRTAQRAYELAVQEVSVKKGLIDLEYALLEAQRDQLEADLRARREILAADNNPANDRRIAQIDTIVEKLGRVDLLQAADNAKQVIDRQVESARLELQTAITRTAKPAFMSGFISAVRGITERGTARSSAENTLATARSGRPENTVAGDTQAQKNANAGITNPIVESNKKLVDKIGEWIAVIEKQLGVARTGNRMSLRDAFDYANQNGFIGGELKGVTRVGTHAKNSKHYSGEAFDVNIGRGNVEANNPEMSKRMDALAEYYRSQGFKVLWKVAGHFNHMHVEIGSAIQKAMGSLQADTSAAAANAVKSIETSNKSVGAANDNTPSGTVTVTGRRPDNSPVQPEPMAPPESKKQKNSGELEKTLGIYSSYADTIVGSLREIGPEGDVLASVVTGLEDLGNVSFDTFKTLSDGTASSVDKFEAVANAASTALSVVQSALSASASAKVAAVDKEIAAEQKRDGKSAESVAKIQALEKKKDQIEKKRFDTNKKISMAQAVIATAVGVAEALKLGPIAGPILAGLIGALGAAQLAIIAGTQYQSTSSAADAGKVDVPTLTIGKRGDTVDLAKSNSNLGGELGFLRGTPGVGTNSANYAVVGSAYGGNMPRGYGHSAYVVGEKGPETITMDTPITVRPANDNSSSTPLHAEINIHAIDAQGVENVLRDHRGNIIHMLREAANASGTTFMEDVNTAVYTRPNVGSRL